MLKRLFGKKGGDADEKSSKVKAKAKKQKPAKKSKGEKGKKGKQPDNLVQLMQIEESVAAASLDVVEGLKNVEGSAVRELDEGLLIIAFTNDGLEATGIDSKDEEFGSFSESLRSETIESIALMNDLERDVVGIIPSRETLLALSEYNFVQDLVFHWAILPFDVTDDSQLDVFLEQEVTIGDVLDVANNPSITFEVHDGQIQETIATGGATGIMDGIGGVQDDDDLFDGQADDGDDLFPNDDDTVDDDTFEPMDDALDEPLDEPFEPMDDSMDSGDTFDTFEDDSMDSFDEVKAVFDGVDDSFDDEVDDNMSYEEELEVANTIEQETKRLTEHTFQNDELGLSINMEIFDDYFDSIDVAQFDVSDTSDGELDRVLNKLRQDANTELRRFRQHNIEELRNKYASSMRDIHIKLTEALDYESYDTLYGEKYQEIHDSYEKDTRDIDRKIAGRRDELQAKYNKRRDEFGEQARVEAMTRFDMRYRDELESEIRRLRDDVRSDLVTGRDLKVAELFDDRRITGKRLFDKATASLLRDIQSTFQDIARRELQMYDAFRKDMDAYLRRHFADEVLRAKAEAEKMRQSHEAEAVRQKYEQLLNVRMEEIDELERKARENINKLEQTHREQIKALHDDYAHKVERQERDNENLRSLLSEANESISTINEQKDKEVEHRMKMYEDAIKAKDKEIEYANERANRTQKPYYFIIGAVALVFLALGVLFGFMFSANKTYHIAPSAPEDVGAVSYMETVPSIDYDKYFVIEDSNDVA